MSAVDTQQGQLGGNLGPDPEPLGGDRFERLMSRLADADTGRRRCARLPIPARGESEPALLAPYLTDGSRLLRIVSHGSLGSEMVMLLEDCETLEVALYTWRELAGRVRAVRHAAAIARE